MKSAQAEAFAINIPEKMAVRGGVRPPVQPFFRNG